ncbi:metallo-beta-lactamase family protein [Chlamydoabsidia padenii]|nr:metallo-beta-lactamase family protein [Chlamydoabsidia padenii]
MDSETNTAQYIVTDLETREAYVIDSVLDYEPLAGVVSPTTARTLIDFIQHHDLHVTKVIETHVHADHLTAASYIKENLSSKPEIWIGKGVSQVQETFGKKYNTTGFENTGGVFDRLVESNETWTLGKSIQCSVIATPGHTPACVSYLIGDAAFVGDTLFMPDLGTARCDFPGGNASALYKSIHTMYDSWPEDTRIYVGHDYPPPDRSKFDVMTSLEKQKQFNKMIHVGVSLTQFVEWRNTRDRGLKVPRLIHPSLQVRERKKWNESEPYCY